MAEDLLLFCSSAGGPITTGGGDLTIDLHGGTDAPPWLESSGGQGATARSGPRPQPLGPHPGGTPFKLQHIGRFELRGGDRIRLTLAWYDCPAGAHGTGPAPLDADLDLWLCDWDAQSCLGVSRSYDNNSEGFDVTVPPHTPKARYEVHVGYDPDNSPGCGGVTKIPAAWAYAHAPSTEF